MAVRADIDTDTIAVAVRGWWDRPFGLDVHQALNKCMSEHPAALILDLRGVTDPRAVSVPAWLTTRRVGRAMRPPVQVLTCPDADSELATRLHRLADPRAPWVLETPEQAEAVAVASRPPPGRRYRVRLSPQPYASSAARDVISEACAAWHLDNLLHRARLVVSELVANAAEHARTPITVLISRRGEGLHIVVADGDPRLPVFPDPPSPPMPAAFTPATRGRVTVSGLRLVECAATVYGALPAATGKIVWATLYPWARRR
ncbi:ATP-binding protein [Actinoplanes sp. NPDC049596]|uniref:ATP-binding protein n=1 Tax=unclassified Actinoplanes TaxID=2626549 RepID=UPI003428ED6B